MVFPKKLRWLYWRGLHLKSLPNEFSLENIVSLDIRNSRLAHVWKVTKVLLFFYMFYFSLCTYEGFVFN